MAYNDNDAFCVIGDVERIIQRGVFSGTTRPTQQQVWDFMQARASYIQAKMWEAGHQKTVPSGGAPLASGTDSDKNIKSLATDANARLAAGDVIKAHEVLDDQTVSETAQHELKLGAAALETLLIAVSNQVTEASEARSATATGGITKAQFNETGSNEERARSSMYSLDTKW